MKHDSYILHLFNYTFFRRTPWIFILLPPIIFSEYNKFTIRGSSVFFTFYSFFPLICCEEYSQKQSNVFNKMDHIFLRVCWVFLGLMFFTINPQRVLQRLRNSLSPIILKSGYLLICVQLERFSLFLPIPLHNLFN